MSSADPIQVEVTAFLFDLMEKYGDDGMEALLTVLIAWHINAGELPELRAALMASVAAIDIHTAGQSGEAGKTLS